MRRPKPKYHKLKPILDEDSTSVELSCWGAGVNYAASWHWIADPHIEGRSEMRAFAESYISKVLRAAGQPVSGLASQCRWLRATLSDPYRPELHYMRGPGPKWREKHAPGAERYSLLCFDRRLDLGPQRRLRKHAPNCSSVDQDAQPR